MARWTNVTALRAAPAAPFAPPPKPAPVLLQQVEALGGNQRACRDAAPKIRRAGVKMPEPLIVLAALDPKFFGAMQPAGQ